MTYLSPRARLGWQWLKVVIPAVYVPTVPVWKRVWSTNPTASQWRPGTYDCEHLLFNMNMCLGRANLEKPSCASWDVVTYHIPSLGSNISRNPCNLLGFLQGRKSYPHRFRCSSWSGKFATPLCFGLDVSWPFHLINLYFLLSFPLFQGCWHRWSWIGHWGSIRS